MALESPRQKIHQFSHYRSLFGSRTAYRASKAGQNYVQALERGRSGPSPTSMRVLGLRVKCLVRRRMPCRHVQHHAHALQLQSFDEFRFAHVSFQQSHCTYQQTFSAQNPSCQRNLVDQHLDDYCLRIGLHHHHFHHVRHCHGLEKA